MRKKSIGIKGIAKSFIKKNKSKPLFMFLIPISNLIYFIFFLWIFKKNKWIKNSVAPIWNIINIAFLSSPASFFISFILPITFIIILGNISHPSTAIAGIMAQIPILILVIAMPIIFVDFKRSSLLKRLYISNVKKSVIIFSFSSYFVLLSFLSIVLSSTLGMFLYWDKEINLFFEYKKLSSLFQYINWGNLIFGICINIFFSCSVGILISSYARTPMFALSIGIAMLVPGGFLSGQYFSLGFVLKNNVMNYASYFFWQKYPTAIILSSFDISNTGDPFNPNYVPYDIFSNDEWKVIQGFETIQPDIKKIFTPEVVSRMLKDNLSQSTIDEIAKNIQKAIENVTNDDDVLTQLKEQLKILEKTIKEKWSDFNLYKYVNLDINSFVKKEYFTILNPVKAAGYVAASVVLPFPLTIFGIVKFNWTTR